MKKTIVIALVTLCAGGILAMAQGPPQTWTWNVEVRKSTGVNLIGDTNGIYETVYKDGVYLVNVGVSKLTKSAYRFRLHIKNGSGRDISMPGVGSFSDVYLNPEFGPGYFPQTEGDCEPPGQNTCKSLTGCLETFLALPHPVCEYASVLLQITVPKDIERMPINGPETLVDGHVRLYIENTSVSYQDEDKYAQYHNMDALTLPTGTAPLRVRRTGSNIWTLRVLESPSYMNYGEFYFGFLRKRPGDNKISMLVNGSFDFDTTWTRK